MIQSDSLDFTNRINAPKIEVKSKVKPKQKPTLNYPKHMLSNDDLCLPEDSTSKLNAYQHSQTFKFLTGFQV